MTLQQKVIEQFLEKVAASKDMDAGKVESLRKLLATTKKIKAEDLVRIFSQPAGGDLK